MSSECIAWYHSGNAANQWPQSHALMSLSIHCLQYELAIQDRVWESGNEASKPLSLSQCGKYNWGSVLELNGAINHI